MRSTKLAYTRPTMTCAGSSERRPGRPRLWTGLIITLMCAACGGGTGPEPDDVFDWPGAYAGTARFEAWQPGCGADGCSTEPYARTDCDVALQLIPVGDSAVTGALELSRCVEAYRYPYWTPPRIPFLRMGSFGTIEGRSFLYDDPYITWGSAVHSGNGAPAALGEVVGCSPRGDWQRWFLGLQPYRDGPESPAVETILGTLQYVIEETLSEVGNVPLVCAGIDVRLSLKFLVEKVMDP